MQNKRQPSVMNHQFSQVPKAEIQRSSFDRSHGYKTTFDAGYLVPFFIDEVVPGDTFNLRASMFARLATPIVPFMDNIKLDTHFFFVPYRLVWDNFQKFMGEQTNPDEVVGDFLMPQVTSPTGGWAVGSMADYFGIPTLVEGFTVNALPFRSYHLIFNQWYRDQNLQNSLPVPKGDGPDTASSYATLRKRGKRHDYFTSCLPFPQKGPDVQLPLGTRAYIKYDSFAKPNPQDNAYVNAYSVDGGLGDASLAYSTSLADGGDPLDNNGGNNLFADLTTATAATINDLREAFQVQRLFERDARGGTRYTEIIQSHFGVTSDDARLQRPEYLGGGTTDINIHPIAQTSSTDATTPQANLAAIGTASANGHGFVRSFTEHGTIIGIVSARADLTYQNSLNRMWSRQTRLDYYWPVLAHLGEQAVLNKEIKCTGLAADDDVFGYQERYAEYRYKPSLITGKFRSSDPQPLDIWHLAQNFATTPELGPDFIEENPPIDRVIAVPSEPHFLLDTYINLKCVRPMPLYSVPGLIDHF